VVLVPILRAGMALLPAFLALFPEAPIGFFGIKRDEKTALPHLYYEKLPSIAETDTVFLLDPMIATGGTACLALKLLKQKGAKEIFLFAVIGATIGMKKVEHEHPEVKMLVAAEDPELNAQKMIVPGLGDFGDRYFS
jgi:uracil phosphoribosyltransferase